MMVAVVAVAVLVAGSFVWFDRDPTLPSASLAASSETPTPLAEPSEVDRSFITVHVSGEVVNPGLVRLVSPARVADAIAASGGATGEADLSRLNLAAGVGDSMQVVVPRSGGGASSPGGDTSVGPVHLNTGSLDDLLRLPGVGPIIAQRIIDHRSANGPFRVVEDLLDVPGIGEGKLAAIRDVVAVP